MGYNSPLFGMGFWLVTRGKGNNGTGIIVLFLSFFLSFVRSWRFERMNGPNELNGGGNRTARDRIE